MSENNRAFIEDNVNRSLGAIIGGLVEEELIEEELGDYIYKNYSVMLREPNWFKKQMDKITKKEEAAFKLVKHPGAKWYPDEKDEGPNGETIEDETN